MATPDGLRPRPTSRFDRDLKRLAKRGKDMSKLRDLIEDLRHRRPLPARCRDHALVGDWKGYRDCHVEPDWLLVYRADEAAGVLVLDRTGSHTDVFG